MRFYTTIQQVKLASTAVAKAQAFSKAVTRTTDYADSQQIVPRKIMQDHFISKLGEEAAKIVLSQYGPVVGPDYNIYEGKAKSWSADLALNGVGIAVKTQARSSAARYGLSWTFQCGNPRRDRILTNPEAWVVFVEYDDATPYTCYVYPPVQIRDLQFDEPKIARLKGSKKVVYARTLPQLSVKT